MYNKMPQLLTMDTATYHVNFPYYFHLIYSGTNLERYNFYST